MKKVIYVFCILFLSSTLMFAQIKVGIGLNGGVKIPSGQIADVWGNAYGGSASLTLDVLRTVQLSADIGYYRAAVASKFTDNLSALYSQKIDVTWPLNLVPISAGIKIFLIPGAVKPYIGGDAGTIVIKADKASVSAGGQSLTVDGSDMNVSGFYFSGGAGIQFVFASGLILDVNVKYDGASENVKAATQKDSSNLKFVAINAGLLIGI